MNQVTFNEPDRKDWIRLVQEARHAIKETKIADIFIITIGSKIKTENFEPFHIVMLSSFIQKIKAIGYLIRLQIKDVELNNFVFNNINIKSYWTGGWSNYIASSVPSDLNLWRIVDAEKEAYSISIHDYFQRRYFKEKDLSSLKNSLNELYSNVFDHAKAIGNAFSYIGYNEKERKINIAICDFGIGVAQSLRGANKIYTNDKEALRDSIEKGVTARSQKHNRGWGLDNIMSALSENNTFRIVSNKALLIVKSHKENIKMIDIDFDFQGTLIYFDISIDGFPVKDNTLEVFSWDD